MAMPPVGEWVATERGVARWRAAVSSVTVEPIGGTGQRLLTVCRDGAEAVQVLLSEAQAGHLARLLRPPAEAAA